MLFIENKYTRIYYSIINNAQSRILPKETYTEKHHIIPKSLGGSNAKDNLAVLTAREHFICHWLLTKMTTSPKDTAKMAYACKRMMHGFGKGQQRYKISSSLYETLKVNLNTILKNRVFSDEWKEKLSKSAIVRCSNESPETKSRRAKQLRELGKSRKGIKKPYATGQNNTFASSATKEKLRLRNLEKYGYENPAHIPYTCEHCGSSGKGLAGYNRWHGSNCRHIQSA